MPSKNDDSLAMRILQTSQKRMLVDMEKNVWKLIKIATIVSVIVTPLVFWFTKDFWRAILPAAVLAFYVGSNWVNYFVTKRRVVEGTFGSSADDVLEIKKHLARDQDL